MTEIADIEQLREIVSLANKVPEKYQVAAFSGLLEHHLRITRVSLMEKRQDNLTRNSNQDYLEDPHKKVTAPMSYVPPDHEIAALGRDAQACWAVIKLHEDQAKATVTAIRKHIKDHLGISPEDKSNLSTRLGKLTPQYLRREKEGRGYIYFPNGDNLQELFQREK